MDALTRSSLQDSQVVLVGIPSDVNSSFLRGPAEAPTAIRQVLHSGSSNWSAENEFDLSAAKGFEDVGDLQLRDGPGVISQIEEGIASLLRRGVKLLSLGGDHAVTYPIVKAHAQKHGQLNILHLDAHPDLYDEFEGNPYSHACPFARIMEESLALRLVQVGIRTINKHQRSQAERFGVEVIAAGPWSTGLAERQSALAFTGPVYLTLDMDVLDPAFAPGVSHHEPGGLSTREVLQVIQAIPVPILGADIVELNPRRDPTGITAAAAAKFVKEIAARMLQNN
jgi:arginase